MISFSCYVLLCFLSLSLRKEGRDFVDKIKCLDKVLCLKVSEQHILF